MVQRARQQNGYLHNVGGPPDPAVNGLFQQLKVKFFCYLNQYASCLPVCSAQGLVDGNSGATLWHFILVTKWIAKVDVKKY